jgi:high affinity Mn2+ porin
VVEAYYSALVYRGTHLTLDYQRITDPGYTFDRRGPVNLLGARFHVEI